MAEAVLKEKEVETTESIETIETGNTARTKFLVGGLVILIAVGYLIVSSFGSSAQYFLTVEELHGKGDTILGKDVRISGIVIGDSIQYDAKALRLEFDIVDDLQHPENPLHVVYIGPKPDLMQDEAQAIIEGTWNEDGTFYAHDRADSLLLKCPTRYEEEYPDQADA